jgi:hypothetical protein
MQQLGGKMKFYIIIIILHHDVVQITVVWEFVEFVCLLSTYDVCTVVERICFYWYCVWVALNNLMDNILFTFPFCA